MRTLLIVSIALMTLLVIACGESDPTPVPTAVPTSTPVPTSAPAPTNTPVPTSTPAPTSTPVQTGGAYPITVTDLLGRVVEIPEAPEAILPISPTAQETLYRVGGTAIGRVTSAAFPPETEDLPTVGSVYAPNVEAIVSLGADLFIIEALTQAHMVDMLRSAGAPIIAVRATSLEDVEKSLAVVGEAIGRADEADEIAAQIRVSVEAAVASIASAPSMLILISDADRNIYAAKPESYPGAVAAVLGLENLAEGLPDAGPFPGYSLLSIEKILASDPDFVFGITPAPPPVPRLTESLKMIPPLAGLGAIRSGRVAELDPDLFMIAPGPRFADAVDEITALVNEAAP